MAANKFQLGWASSLKQAATITALPIEWAPHVSESGAWQGSIPQGNPMPFDTPFTFGSSFDKPSHPPNLACQSASYSSSSSSRSSGTNTSGSKKARRAIQRHAPAAVTSSAAPAFVPFKQEASDFVFASRAVKRVLDAATGGAACMVEEVATSYICGEVEEAPRACYPAAQGPSKRVKDCHVFRDEAASLCADQWVMPVSPLQHSSSSACSGGFCMPPSPPSMTAASPSRSASPSSDFCDLSLSLRSPGC